MLSGGDELGGAGRIRSLIKKDMLSKKRSLYAIPNALHSVIASLNFSFSSCSFL